MNKKITLSGFAISLVLITFLSCSKEVAKLQGPTDAQMAAWAMNASGTFYYQNDSTNQIPPASQQGGFHGPYKLRYNHIVKDQLGGDGKIASGTVLNDSALIVKVAYTGSAISGYAVMFKLNGSWNWGMYDATGAVGQFGHSVGSDASLCRSCHDGTGNRDKTLTFTYH